MISWQANATQNSQWPKTEPLIGSCGSYNAKFGKTLAGPIRSGAVALATRTVVDPMIWAMHKVAATCTLLRVCNKIIPRPTPWIASRTPNQSHSDATMTMWQVQKVSRAFEVWTTLWVHLLPKYGPAPPAHGMYRAAPLVPHRIWHHLGAPSPIAKTGSSQVCRLEKWLRTHIVAWEDCHHSSLSVWQ